MNLKQRIIIMFIEIRDFKLIIIVFIVGTNTKKNYP